MLFQCALQVWSRRVRKLQATQREINERNNPQNNDTSDAWIYSIESNRTPQLINYGDDMDNFNLPPQRMTWNQNKAKCDDSGLPSYEEAIAAQNHFDNKNACTQQQSVNRF